MRKTLSEGYKNTKMSTFFLPDMNPVDVWNLVRMKILPYFTPWDYVCDRTRVMGTKFSNPGAGGNPESGATTSSVAKLKFLLQEMNDLAEELSLLVVGCCDTIEDAIEPTYQGTSGS